MPKAEVGSTKHIANKMKSKGLQRLRWYCQICAKQCRDENGFKQHTLSEGHVRAMLLVGEDPKKVINDYSRQFQRDFLQLLRTSHGEKKVYMNQFYQEYIRDKEHVHMNATKWPSLTEFAKHLGREGICRVEEADRGLEIAWVDDSAEAIRRREDIKKKDRLMKGDEDAESRMLEQQIRRAKEEAARASKPDPVGLAEVEGIAMPPVVGDDAIEGRPVEPIKVSGFSLKSKGLVKPSAKVDPEAEGEAEAIEVFTSHDKLEKRSNKEQKEDVPREEDDEEEETGIKAKAKANVTVPTRISLNGLKKKPINPLAKKNPFAKAKPPALPEPEKKMSNAERIMKEELERKRSVDERAHSNKRPRLG